MGSGGIEDESDLQMQMGFKEIEESKLFMLRGLLGCGFMAVGFGGFYDFCR